MHLVSDVSQHGPNGGFAMFQNWFWVLLVIPLCVALFILYRLFFPTLNRVKVRERLEDRVEEEMGEDGTVTDIESGAQGIESEETVAPRKAPIDVALRLMQSDERKVVEALLEAEGSLLQKEISWETGFSRVKTHRILVRLIQRGVVTSEKYYNTNKITLSNWLLNP